MQSHVGKCDAWLAEHAKVIQFKSFRFQHVHDASAIATQSGTHGREAYLLSTVITTSQTISLTLGRFGFLTDAVEAAAAAEVGWVDADIACILGTVLHI